MQVLTCVASFPAVERSKRALQSVATVLLFAVVCCLTLPAQKFELAKISLGMSEQDAKAAIGPGYEFFREPAPNFPNVLYLYAGNPAERTSYTFALIDGKIQGFKFFKRFAENEYPLAENIRKSVAAKLWQPQKPNGTTWISDSTGKPLADTGVLNCSAFGATFESDGFIERNAKKMSGPMYETLRGSTYPQADLVDPRCGIFVRMWTGQYYANPALATDTGLEVKNVGAFSALERQRRQIKQDEQKAQAQQANKAKSPY